MSAHATVDGEALLALWELGIGCAPMLRAEALLAAAEPDAAPPACLGERNRRLLALQARLFGPALVLTSRCPTCGAVAEFDVDCMALLGRLPPGEPSEVHRLAWASLAIAFRLPRAEDVARAAETTAHGAIAPPSEGTTTADAFAMRLVARCFVSADRDGATVPLEALPPAALDAVSVRMEALDPAARIEFAVDCPECTQRWSAPLDPAAILWRLLQSAAEALLLDVDALARAYGWREADVLALSPTRRAAYLQMVSA